MATLHTRHTTPVIDDRSARQNREAADLAALRESIETELLKAMISSAMLARVESSIDRTLDPALKRLGESLKAAK